MRLVLFLLVLTANAFAQWQMQESHTTESLRGVSVVNANVVWASGTRGTYLVTTNGGETWTPHQVPGAEELDFRGAKAFGSEAFMLAAGPGDKSRIYHTNDSGRHWELQFTNPEPKGFFDCMAFTDRRHGVVVGDPVNGKFQILSTHDGGRKWRFADSTYMPPALESEGAFAASNSCIMAIGHNVWFASGGPAARVFRSTDDGKTWSVSETPIQHGAASQGIFSMAFKDVLHGVIAGGDYAHPEQGGNNLATTDDGGKSWKLISIQPQKFFSAIVETSHSSSNTLIVAAGSAASALSTDGLHSWKFIGSMGFNAIASSGAATYAVGANGAIAKLAPRN